MLESEKATGGAESTSGAVDELKDSVVAEDPSGAGETVPRKLFEKVLREKKNNSTELKHLKAWKESVEQEKMLEREEHIKVIDLLRQENEKLKGEKLSYEKQKAEAKKSASIISELKKLGFADNESNREIALKLFDKENVEIDTATNVVIGADMAAKAFYDKYNSLGIFSKKPAGTSSHAPNMLNNSLAKSVSEMNEKEKAQKLNESLNKFIGG